MQVSYTYILHIYIYYIHIYYLNKNAKSLSSKFILGCYIIYYIRACYIIYYTHGILGNVSFARNLFYKKLLLLVPTFFLFLPPEQNS